MSAQTEHKDTLKVDYDAQNAAKALSSQGINNSGTNLGGEG
jgi:hypothetical protein